MAQLAIQGHATRGKEVIEILEMLGGRNSHNLIADCDSLCFYVGKGTNKIYYDWVRDCCEDEYTLVFTIEKFLEKFPYKVGDKVMTDDGDKANIVGMVWDNDINDVFYETQICNEVFRYPKELLQPYKEETMEEIDEKAVNHVFETEVISFDIAQRDKYELDLQGKFEVVLREGKYYVERIKPKYPKTYEECCDVLGTYPIYNNPNLCKCEWHPETREIHEYYSKLANLSQEWVVFMKLLICRDAYWKIAGDWKPDWNDNSKFKYTITCKRCNIIMYSYSTLICILAFPTAEMRDAFYDNFKQLIETCKEFL